MAAIRFPDLPGAKTILVVEDDSALRILMGQMLSLAGFRPLLADGLQEALRLARDESTIDLLITDFRMPEISGIGLASRLREDRPDLPVLFVSGYAVGPIAETMDFLPKPFSRDELIDAVRAILDRARDGSLAQSTAVDANVPTDAGFIL